LLQGGHFFMQSRQQEVLNWVMEQLRP